VSQRVYSFLNTLFRDRKGKKVWIVLHGGTLRALRFLLERWDFDRALKWPEGQTPENCGITVYDYDKKEERLVLKEYNKVVWR
jgi:broad specificity phosphatase PhoE